MEISCESGFDGGHESRYHLEVFENRNHLANNLSKAEPHFYLHRLKAGHDYTFLAYASNLLGRSEARRMNVTTLNVAEKRTAETKSKLAAVESPDSPLSASAEESGQQIGGVGADQSLALLPVVAILCGVAVGLATVALGVILLVRGRSDEVTEGGGSLGPGAAPGGSEAAGDTPEMDRRGKYDAVATSAPPDDDYAICAAGERQIRQQQQHGKSPWK